MAKQNHYKQALQLLKDLHQLYPGYGMGRHIATALSDYGDFWGITDKEFCFALEKYSSELELDLQNIASDEYVKKIVKDAEDLNHILDEDDDEDDEEF